jgi:hypothetical protein
VKEEGRQLECSTWWVRSSCGPERSARIWLWKARRECASSRSGSTRRMACVDGLGMGGVATNASWWRSQREAAAEAASACTSGKSNETVAA